MVNAYNRKKQEQEEAKRKGKHDAMQKYVAAELGGFISFCENEIEKAARAGESWVTIFPRRSSKDPVHKDWQVALIKATCPILIKKYQSEKRFWIDLETENMCGHTVDAPMLYRILVNCLEWH